MLTCFNRNSFQLSGAEKLVVVIVRRLTGSDFNNQDREDNICSAAAYTGTRRDGLCILADLF